MLKNLGRFSSESVRVVMQRVLLICGLLWLGPALALAQEAAAEKFRSHRAGPLTADDFQAKPDPKSSYIAWTETSLQFHFKYRSETKNGQRVVTLTDIDVWAVLTCDKSWNLRPTDPLLMDHEQGHFDLTEVQARLARNQLRRLMKRRDALTFAKAPREAEAVAKLKAAIAKFMEAYTEACQANHQAYDEATRNGREDTAQANERRQQQAQLEALAREWELLDR